MPLNKYGLEKNLYLCAGLFFLRFIISLIMASETKNMSLIEASSLNESGSQKKSTLGFRGCINKARVRYGVIFVEQHK